MRGKKRIVEKNHKSLYHIRHIYIYIYIYTVWYDRYTSYGYSIFTSHSWGLIWLISYCFKSFTPWSAHQSSLVHHHHLQQHLPARIWLMRRYLQYYGNLINQVCLFCLFCFVSPNAELFSNKWNKNENVIFIYRKITEKPYHVACNWC